MGVDRPSIRTRGFRILARLVHRIGMLAWMRPLLNVARLRVRRVGPIAVPYLRVRMTRNAQILVYHRVNDEGDPYFGGTPTRAFDRQMRYVAGRFHVLPLSVLVRRLRQGTLPDNAIAVTLDDGYRDNYVHAFPVLERYSIPATIFLATAAIGSDRQLWHDDVFSAFRETTADALEPFGPDGLRWPLATVSDRLRAQRACLAHVRTLGEAERSAAIARLRDALGVGPPSPAQGLMLSWAEVKIMSRAGIQFGSHTATHPILSRIDRGRAEREIVDSKRAIEAETGASVDAFAYPNGSPADFTQETKSLLRDAGYAYAVTTVAGPNEPGDDVFELRRATPWDDDIFAFGLRLHYNKLRS